MPTLSQTFRFPEETVDQITEICDAVELKSNYRPGRPNVVIRAIAELHAAVCRPAAASTSTAAVPAPPKRRTKESRS
jgi:hypothetical protein